MSAGESWNWMMAGTAKDEGSGPEFSGRPDDVVPGSLALDLMLGQRADAAVFVGAFQAYPTGVSCRLEVRISSGSPWLFPTPGAEDIGYLPSGLAWGVTFADGSASEPVPHGSFATEQSMSTDYWFQPLPPPGPVTVWCVWPERNLPHTQQAFDATLLHEAAARSRTLWR